MFERADVVFCYDGSFAGLLTCMFRIFQMKKEPIIIKISGSSEISLYDQLDIDTDIIKAKRVWSGIIKHMSYEAAKLAAKGFLSCADNKEVTICRFLQLGFKYGASVMNRTDDDIIKLKKAALHAEHEAHMLKGFIRFTEQNGVLIAEIEPKNFVLPLLKDHFSERYRNESFFIYDKTHNYALTYKAFKSCIIPIESFIVDPISREENDFMKLWKSFYDKIAINERYNPKSRASNIQKRFIKNMAEFKEIDS